LWRKSHLTTGPLPGGVGARTFGDGEHETKATSEMAKPMKRISSPRSMKALKAKRRTQAYFRPHPLRCQTKIQAGDKQKFKVK
jgi:hypothetical protein